MHHQRWYPTFIADVQYLKYGQSGKKRRRGVLEQVAHQTLSVKEAMNHNPTYLWKRASIMKCNNDFVSQHAVNLFLEPLRSVRICDDSVRIRTDTTLDQDVVLKATVQVCTACMIMSLLTTCLNLSTPHLAQVAPFRCKIRESNAEVPLDTKLSKHVCQLILVCTNLRFQAWSTAS